MRACMHALAQDDVSPLHAAALNGHLNCCSLLIWHGADINAISKARVGVAGGLGPGAGSAGAMAVERVGFVRSCTA